MIPPLSSLFLSQPIYKALMTQVGRLELQPKNRRYFDRLVSKAPQNVCLSERLRPGFPRYHVLSQSATIQGLRGYLELRDLSVFSSFST